MTGSNSHLSLSALQPEVRISLAEVEDDLAVAIAVDDEEAVDDDVFADAYLPPNRRNWSPSGCMAANRAFLRNSCTVNT